MEFVDVSADAVTPALGYMCRGRVAEISEQLRKRFLDSSSSSRFTAFEVCIAISIDI